jgi:SAM-dependent methyltransferase
MQAPTHRGSWPRAIRRVLGRWRRELLLKHQCEERYILERKLFPLARGKKVLLVGCRSYTRDYPSRLRHGEVWSLDIDPDVREFGAQNHHVGDIADPSVFPQPEAFDLIFMGGVIGWGLNDPADADRALANCRRLLRPGGLLMLWWNDTPGHDQVNPRRLSAFRLFSPVQVASYPSGYRTRANVVLEFLRK